MSQDTNGGNDRKPLTPEEVRQLIEDVARSGEGASQLRALLALSSEQVKESVLPAPLNEDEVIDRLSRLNVMAGIKCARLAMVRAFPKRIAASKLVQSLAGKFADEIDQTKLPRTLKALYRAYPEIRQPGYPKGFPVHGSPEKQKEWCHSVAIKIEVERKQSAVIAAEDQINSDFVINELKGKDAAEVPEGSPGPQATTDPG